MNSASTAATQATAARVSRARTLKSARFPKGVATTYNAPDSIVIVLPVPAKAHDTTAQRGREAEALAARYLEARGLTVIRRNFRVRGGEIDLICRDGAMLVFVEVRLRSRDDFGGAAASIGPEKRRRLILAARHYLAGCPETDCRFDCVLLARVDGNGIEWLRNAFSADD